MKKGPSRPKPLFAVLEIHPEDEYEEHEEYVAAVFSTETDAVLYQAEMANYAICNGNVSTIPLSDGRAAVILKTREGERRAHALVADLSRVPTMHIPSRQPLDDDGARGVLEELHLDGAFDAIEDAERIKILEENKPLIDALEAQIKELTGRDTGGMRPN